MRKTSVKETNASVAERLIETAEDLYGRLGIEGVSLRQISTAAGTGNNYAVQYHFGDADGLIEAIHRERIPEVERSRARLLSAAKAAGRLKDVRTLMDILYRPVIDQRNSQGDRAYARLVLALHGAPSGLMIDQDLFELMPIAEHVLDLISAQHPEISPEYMRERQRLVCIMVLTSVFNRRAPFEGPCESDALIDDVLDMATAALTAPVAASLSPIVRPNASRG
jgi:AcrR family transcriptional regulator